MAGVNDKPGYIKPALTHLRQCDLGSEILGIVHRFGEVGCVNVDVGVERNDIFMDLFGFGNEPGLAAAILGTDEASRQCKK